jgi:hypothetical protein
MSTAATNPGIDAATKLAGPVEFTVYSHSNLLYWWPVWVTGYIMAILTAVDGVDVDFRPADQQAKQAVVQPQGQAPAADPQAEKTVVRIHPSKNLGVIYTIVFMLVAVLTNATVRGLASALVIAIILALTFLFAYLDVWDDIFEAFRHLAMYMNLGFYVFFSTAILIVWALSVFVFDRMEYWTFRPGQVIHNRVIGGGTRSYDTTHMSVFKLRDDLFRHWILGLGSGDLHIATAGANSHEMVLPNVLFAGSKVLRIQQLVAMKPDEQPSRVPMTVGEPG